jgi:drug/metabolite transporter (DMT)-like permease
MSLIRPALMVFAAMSLIVTGDTAGKLMAQGGVAVDPVAPAFIAWSRFAMAALILLPLSGMERGAWRMLTDWRVILRALLIVGGISCILIALRTEPIANVFGAFFIGPVVAYVLAALLLGEPVSPARSALLALGFAGVMLVVKPGFGMTPGLGFALLAGTFYGGYLVATRWLAGAFRPRFLLISQLMIGAVVLAPTGIAALPAAFDLRLVGLVVLSALASAAGNYLLVTVNRVVPAGRIAPLVYTQLIAAMLAGVVVFGDWPDGLSLIGLAVILISGLASLRVVR